VALCFVPFEPVWIATAFVLFRVLDVVKPGPIGWAERRLSGGAGVMGDDILAGLFAGALAAAAHAAIAP
jgi:phosphatidylglycerophosphatase A